jgi:hypothetical protein
MSRTTQSKVTKSGKLRKPKATAAEMQQRLAAVLAIAQRIQPANVRSVFYQAVVASLVEKDEIQGYRPVQKALATLRLSGALGWDAILDLTRSVERPLVFRSIAERLELAANNYRRDLWMDEPEQVLMMVEKQGLGGVFRPVTRQFAVPLLPQRGYSSLTFLKEGAEILIHGDKPAHVYYFADFDPSGQNAPKVAERRLREFAPEIELDFTTLAVTPEQIARLALPTRPTKKDDARLAAFESEHGVGTGSVELDAVDPNVLRALAQRAIEIHLPPARYAELMQLEADDRATLRGLIDQIAP